MSTKTPNLFRKLLRIVTPEEVSEIATKYSDIGRIVSLTELLKEKLFKNVHRDFSKLASLDGFDDDFDNELDVIHEIDAIESKTLAQEIDSQLISPSIRIGMRPTQQIKENEDFIQLNSFLKNDVEDKNMSAFIIEEKERLKKSQNTLKKKEVLSLYEKNSNLDSEEIKNENKSKNESAKIGNLINKKQ